MTMNWIDRALAPLFPRTVARSLAARMAIRAYEAASPSRTHKAKSERRSGNAAVKASSKSIREQARALDENYDIVTGLFDKLEERVVGPKGIGIEPLPLLKDGSVAAEFAAQIKSAWGEWSLRPEASGVLSRPEVERLIVRTWLRDGEALANFIAGNVPSYVHLTDVPFALELLEPDYMPLEDDDTKGVTQGVERNEWGRVKGYHIFKKHPADSITYKAETKFVKSDDMIHIAIRKRIGQVRGISLLAPVLVRLADIKDYEESERVAARIAAALAFYIKKGDPGLYAPNTEADKQTGERTIPFGPGMVFDGLIPGEDVGTIESNRPSALLEGFRNAMIRAVAAGTRGSYSSIARDYNGTYSAQRQELVESQSGYEVLQNQFIDQYARRVYRRWLQVAIASGKIAVPTDVDKSTVFNAVYIGPVMPWIDPYKEANAWEKLVADGFATEAEVIRSRGGNIAELKKQRREEITENREHGLVFNSDAYHEHYSKGESDDKKKRSDSSSDGDDGDKQDE